MAGVALFAIGTLAMIWIVLPLWISSVRRRIDVAARELKDIPREDDRVQGLTQRIAALEATVRSLSEQRPAAAQPPTPAPVAPAARPAPAVVTTRDVTPVVAQPATPPPTAPAVPVRPAAPAAAAPAAATADPPAPSPSVAVPAPVLRPATPPAAVARAAHEPAQPTDPASWEVVVGTSWLNKIGVLVVVVGVALFLGYSMAHVGPAGRVAIGYALAAGMLMAGVALERRQAYANYAYGLIAGGWAGLYFTTYATHAVEAAHVIDSELLATSALVIVAAGMIAHSLKYRSQTVTTLAYVVAYATLMLTPLTSFSIIAAVPLAVSLLVIAERFGWSGVAIFGLASTYGLFAIRTPGASVIRSAAIGVGELDASSLVPYIALATYWVAFEVADILGSRLRRAGAPNAVTPVFALNAVGFVGAALLQLPAGDDQTLSLFLGITGLAYVTSALVRARFGVSRIEPVAEAAGTLFGGVQGAVAIAAALMAWSIDLRFTGSRETLALLLEAELLVAAGLALGDRAIRQIGSFVAVAVTVHTLARVLGTGAPVAWLRDTSFGSVVTVFVAFAWYGNREWLRARGTQAGALEPGYTWAALALLVSAALREAAPVHLGLANLVIATALLEAGIRRGAEYRYQSYIAGTLGALSMMMVFAGPLTPFSLRDVWIVLPAAAVLGYGMAARAAGLAASASALKDELTIVAATASTFAAATLMVLAWRVLSPVAVAPAWAAFGIALLAIGAWRRVGGLRWQGYVALLLAGRVILERLSEDGGAARTELTAGAIVVALLYVSGVIARRETRGSGPDQPAAMRLERVAAIVVSLTATALLLVLQWRGLDPLLVGPGRAITGAIILGVGLWRKIPDLRWQAYALLALGAVTSMQLILSPEPATSAQITWMTIVIGVVYAASLASRAAVKALPEGSQSRQIETACRVGLSLLATVLATSLIVQEVRPQLVTLSWGLTGAALLGAGFLARERVLRLSGLALLLLCIMKLFAHDVWELEALVRIVSFMLLGLVLLAVSWVYTKFREQILKFL